MNLFIKIKTGSSGNLMDNMNDKQRYQQLLGLNEDWEVSDVKIDFNELKVDVILEKNNKVNDNNNSNNNLINTIKTKVFKYFKR